MSAAAAILRQRDLRERLLPKLSETQWLFLLALSDAEERHRKLIVSNLCGGCYAPYTTGLRHLELLERKGLIEREDSPHDTRAVFIALSVLAREKLDRFADAIADTHRNGGDGTKIAAPFMSGGGAQSGIAKNPDNGPVIK